MDARAIEDGGADAVILAGDCGLSLRLGLRLTGAVRQGVSLHPARTATFPTAPAAVTVVATVGACAVALRALGEDELERRCLLLDFDEAAPIAGGATGHYLCAQTARADASSVTMRTGSK